MALLTAIAVIAAITIVVTVRGGLGPADPPASRPYHDVHGFPVPPQPRGALGRRRPRPLPRRVARTGRYADGGSWRSAGRKMLRPPPPPAPSRG